MNLRKILILISLSFSLISIVFVNLLLLSNVDKQNQILVDSIAMLEEQNQSLEYILNNPARVIELRQENFNNGSVVIDNDYLIWTNSNGELEKKEFSTANTLFKLAEDISFNPNKSTKELPPSRSGYVQPQQYQFYDPSAFGIGFFAAIVIQAEDIVLDLNDHTLSQSNEHALQQRFYANIELADQPFIPTEGPASFGTTIKPAENVAIINGTLGRSSHHGIHGQKPNNILLQNLIIHDFEVAGISIHGSNKLSINNVKVEGTFDEVPILGLYSAMRFVKPFLEALPLDYSIGAYTNEDLLTTLNQMNNDVINDNDWQRQYPFIVNESGFTDGNNYGIVVNQEGVAVNGFPLTHDPSKSAKNTFINNTTISNINLKINETPAFAKEPNYPNKGAQTDVVGSVLQVYDFIGDFGEYTGSIEESPIQLAQILVAKAIKEGQDFGFLETKRSSIRESTIDWVEGKISFEESENRFVLNGDSMHHVNKGLNGAKLDGIDGLAINNLSISNLSNVSPECMRYDQLKNYTVLSEFENKYDRREVVGIDKGTLKGASMNDLRAISLASSRNAYLINIRIDNIQSSFGPSIGIDIHFDSANIELNKIIGDNIMENKGNLPGSIEPSRLIKTLEN